MVGGRPSVIAKQVGVFYRPLVGVILLVAALGLMVAVKRRFKPAKAA